MTDLSFKTIDLTQHREDCIEFRRDSYICSYSDRSQRFDAENGADGSGYIEWLQQRIAELPQGCVHVWENASIVGQIESRIRDGNTGYVNLFYVIPDARGRGIGRKLHEYAMAMFADINIDIARLTVSTENKRAMGFYRRLGWIDLGFRSGRVDTRLLEVSTSQTQKV